MARASRQRNERFLAAIRECGWSYEACANAVRVIARENHGDAVSCTRSHVAYWVSGVQPKDRTVRYVAEAVARRLCRVIQPIDLGFQPDGSVDTELDGLSWWTQEPAADLVTVGRADLNRRDVARTALYSLTALAIPLDSWQEVAARGSRAHRSGASVGRGDIDAVRDMLTVFSRSDERFGGGHARLAVVQYLVSDIAAYLRGRFASETERKAMFSTAAELAYLAGWKAFDCGLHGLAQRYYIQALRLANEADDRPLAGFTLRAMAHQAVDLGHGGQALQLADSALAWSRGQTTPATAALFTVLTARGFAATGDKVRAVTAISKAERLLARAQPTSEPTWIQTSGFTETSLASQAGQALRDLGDFGAAERQLQRSIVTRDEGAYRRIHTLTLANLADVQCAQGRLREAADNWGHALDTVTSVNSGRVRAAVQNMRARLGSLGSRLPAFASHLDQRGARFLQGTSTG